MEEMLTALEEQQSMMEELYRELEKIMQENQRLMKSRDDCMQLAEKLNSENRTWKELNDSLQRLQNR